MPTSNTPKRQRKKTPHCGKWKWEQEEEHAFNLLKQHLITYPILAYPDFTKPFEIHTDASLQGLGAVLYQELDEKKRVIAYASRGLSRAEKNYPAHKLEFLALKWSVTEKFKDYLYGQKFVAVTDNNPLTYVLSSAKLDATSQRWVAALAAYDFVIRYRPGKNNADADALSRLPSNSEEKIETIQEDTIKALCKTTHDTQWIDCLVLQPDETTDTNHPSGIGSIDVRSEQENDTDLKWWKEQILNGVKPNRRAVPPSPIHQTMLRNFEKLEVKDGMLYRTISIDSQQRRQLVVPKSKVPLVLQLAHDNMGHQGRDKTTSLIRDRFFWCGMTKDIEDYIKNCHRCICRKTPLERAALVNIATYQPLELVCMDFLSLETSKGGFQSILVITDHFTRYAIAVPTKNQTARTTAEAFINNFVIHYGLPQRIHSDQGANFESKLIKEMCDLTGISKSHTTPYHPMGNGLCERFNRTLLGMLGTLEPDKKRDWKAHVAPLVHAYNATRQESTGYSPYQLMFGRDPILPMDLVFGLNKERQVQPTTKYVEKLEERLRNAYKLATKNADQARGRQKDNYDLKVRNAVIHPGDVVLVRIVAFDGKHKLSDKWESDPYRVLRQPNVGIPVYKVQKKNGGGRIRTLHRNLLLPFLSRDYQHTEPPKDDNETRIRPQPAPRKRNVTTVHNVPTISQQEPSDTSDDDGLVIEVEIPDVDTPGESNDRREPTESEATESEASDIDEEEEVGDAHSSTEDIDETGEESEERQEIPPQPAPRRPQRNRRPPSWIRSGEYVMALQSQPEWIQRAEYLQHIADRGVVQTADVANTILKIVSTGFDT